MGASWQPRGMHGSAEMADQSARMDSVQVKIAALTQEQVRQAAALRKLQDEFYEFRQWVEGDRPDVS